MATKKNNSYKTELRLKTALFYSVMILVDVLILLLLVKGFSSAYQFSYNVFSDSAKKAGSTDYKVITITTDDTSSSVSKKLYDAGLIESKYVMQAKLKVGSFSNKIKAGKYGISPSMTYNEIIGIITGTTAKLNAKDASSTSGTARENLATATDAKKNEKPSESETTEEPADNDEGEGSDEE